MQTAVMQTGVQLRKEKWASKESELDRLVRMATQQGRKEALVPGDAPLVQIVDYLIDEAIRMRASDIHVEPQENGVLVRNRIDGVLRKKHLLPKSLQAPLISRIKIMAFMDIAEKRLPQDGRIKVSFSERRLDLRISIIPSLHGEKGAMRLLDLQSNLGTP